MRLLAPLTRSARTISASPGRKHRAAACLPERSRRHRARQSPRRRHRARRRALAPVPMRSPVSHLSISRMPFPLEQLAADAQILLRISLTATACRRSGAGTPVRDAPREYRARRLARTNVSTSMIFGPRCQSWRDTRFWPRRNASRLASSGSENSVHSQRRAPVNTRDECGRNLSRASRSQARSPSSVMPMGMSIAARSKRMDSASAMSRQNRIS